MTSELAKVYDPKSVEKDVYRQWDAAGAFEADPDAPGRSYCIVIPPPNVTAELHLGHALNNTLQDILIRFRRMQQFNTLWMPGTDHAGIATQTVVEKRILSEEGKRRTEFKRDEFVDRIRSWKDQYEKRILNQLKLMGCSCDWRRTRFTMDDVCAKAVREAFFKLFSDGLIYRGKRLVNWDPATQTVLADDEVEHEQVKGHFWYLRYPLVGTTGGDTGAPPMSVAGVSPMSVAGILPASVAGVSPASSEGVSPSEESEITKRTGRYLPHWTKSGATYAVTFRLADSVPEEVAEGWRREREDILQRARLQNRQLTGVERKELHKLYSARIESYLDSGRGCCVMNDPRIAEIVQNALKHFDADRYDLIAWSVMPNHVHAIVKPLGNHALSAILHSWKSFTAKEVNRVLGRWGQLWMEEYYDHLIRDEEDFNNEVNYVVTNPAKAGLKDWRWFGMGLVSGQDGDDERGRDARDTRGQDARDTLGRDARDTDVEYVTVATTRPETMLGDTAVAMNPADPRAKYLVGKKVRLPIVGRIIPIIADEHVVRPDPDSDDEKARFSTGFLKVTPAHDPDDYAIGQRHGLPLVNVMAPDGTISDKHGWDDCDAPEAQALLGMDRFEAREAVIEWFRQENLLEDVREYIHQVGHSYRSHVPIEPYLSDQWYIAVKKPIGTTGVPSPRDETPVLPDTGETPVLPDTGETPVLPDTDIPGNSLAGLALKPLLDGRVKFTPERYAKTYQAWLENLRDWPISRQLWWGHRIPVWTIRFTHAHYKSDTESDEDARQRHNTNCEEQLRKFFDLCGLNDEVALFRSDELFDGTWPVYVCGRLPSVDRALHLLGRIIAQKSTAKTRLVRQYKMDDDALKQEFGDQALSQARTLKSLIESCELDPDVLDTWFSSALWPFSTLGWPDETPELKTFYPGDVLCTAREIITLWVTRMVMMGQYCLGEIPFTDVFIHAMIQDGDGRKMSKSLGNGIDPLDIIDSHGADAMRFTLAAMTTQTQDVRMPVELLKLPDGRQVNTSAKFDVGRNFCNKLWNASRFAMMNLAGMPAWSEIRPSENLADAWILSRLELTVREATAALESYRFNELAEILYHFTWDDFCDWYLEIAKSRINAGHQGPKAIVAFCLDVLLRLLHPICPFITEAIWERLNEVAPVRGPGEAPAEPLLVKARFPEDLAAMHNPSAEEQFALLRDLIRQIRNIRTQHNVPPARKIEVIAEADAQVAGILADNIELLKSQGGLEKVSVSGEPVSLGADVVAVAAGGVKLYIPGIIDRQAEIARLQKQSETLTRGIRSIEGKLANEGFLKKAPPDLVRRERERLIALQKDLEAVTKSLAALQ